MLGPHKLFKRFLEQPTARRWLILEALWCVLLARALLLLIPFRRLTTTFKRELPGKPSPGGPERQRLRADIRWAIELVSARLPGETTCFPRAIAAQTMCRRRGISAVLCYGAAPLPGKGLSAHVWVLDGTEGVIGHQIAEDYRILARFPS